MTLIVFICAIAMLSIMIIITSYILFGASQVALVVKNPPANAGDIRDVGSIPGSGRSPGGGHGNPLQCSCLENPMHRGAWWAAVHRVAESQTRLKRLSMCAHPVCPEFCYSFMIRELTWGLGHGVISDNTSLNEQASSVLNQPGCNLG